MKIAIEYPNLKGKLPISTELYSCIESARNDYERLCCVRSSSVIIVSYVLVVAINLVYIQVIIRLIITVSIFPLKYILHCSYSL